METAHRPPSRGLSLRISSSSLLVCSNSFRQFLAKHFDVQGIFLVKTGPQRKYFQEGVLRLKSQQGISEAFPIELAYRGHRVTLSLISEAEADAREQESHKKMFVGGISAETSADEIESYFNRFGKTAFVQLITKNPSEHKKFGFVIFEHYSSLAEVYRCAPHYLKGHKLIVMDYVNNTRNRKKKDGDTKAKASSAGSLVSAHLSGAMNAEANRHLKYEAAVKLTTTASLKLATVLPQTVVRKIPTPISIIYKNEDDSMVHTDLSNIRFNIRVYRPSIVELNPNR